MKSREERLQAKKAYYDKNREAILARLKLKRAPLMPLLAEKQREYRQSNTAKADTATKKCRAKNPAIQIRAYLKTEFQAAPESLVQLIVANLLIKREIRKLKNQQATQATI